MKHVLLLVAVYLSTSFTSFVEGGWDFYDFNQLITILVLSYVLFVNIGYSKLLLKSAAFIFLLDSIWCLLQFYMDVSVDIYFAALNVMIFAPWFAWALRRSYEARSVPIEDGKCYWITHNPDNLTSFITSLFGGPVGGYSLYMDGILYGYKKGVFKPRALYADRMHVIAIESVIKESNELRSELSGMAGKKWGLLNNCVTLRAKLWWRYV